MTIRIAQYLGMEKVAEIASRAGVMKICQMFLYGLGAGENPLLTLLQPMLLL